MRQPAGRFRQGHRSRPGQPFRAGGDRPAGTPAGVQFPWWLSKLMRLWPTATRTSC